MRGEWSIKWKNKQTLNDLLLVTTFLFLFLSLRIHLVNNSVESVRALQDEMMDDVKHFVAKANMNKTAKEGKQSLVTALTTCVYRYISTAGPNQRP